MAQITHLKNKILTGAAPEILQRVRDEKLEILFAEQTAFGWHFDVMGESDQNYAVSFFVAEDGTECDFECSCGYFEIHGRPCKHVVAALRFLEKSGE